MLAGGLGRRIGGAKPRRALAGRPLIAYVIEAARDAGLEPVVVAKPDSGLEGIGAPLLVEARQPRHPLVGIATALEAVDAPVVVCPCDLPLVEPRLLAHLATLEVIDRPRLIRGERGIEPLVGVYPAGAAGPLRSAARVGVAAAAAVGELDPDPVDLASTGAAPTSLLNVNDAADLRLASRLLR